MRPSDLIATARFTHAAFRPRFFACAAVRFTAQRRLIASASLWRPSGVKRTFRRTGFCGLAAGEPSAAFFAANASCAMILRMQVDYSGNNIRAGNGLPANECGYARVTYRNMMRRPL
jgi:hypothetical protein